MAGLFLAAVSTLFAGSFQDGLETPASVTNRNGRLSVHVRDFPLGELLQRLCGQLQCDLIFDPRITDRVSVAFDDQDADQALYRTLQAFDYVITWERGAESGPGRHDRISSIRVFRDGHPEDSFLPIVPGPGSVGSEFQPLLARLADRTDPQGARLAAEELARNGSSAALKALFAALPLWNENGALTDAVSRAALSIPGAGSAAGLLGEYLAASDESVALATRFNLSRLADDDLVESIAAQYRESEDPDRQQKLAALIESISSRDAEAGLIALAGSSGPSPAGPLPWAALKALGNLGTATATDHVLERMERGRGDEREELAEIVQNVSASPASMAALRTAARGNKRFASEATRVAAIEGLARFQDGETVGVLEKLTRDPSEAIRLAARQSMEAVVTRE